MKKYMDCIGFKAPSHLMDFMSESLGEIQYLCPYDSYVDAYVTKEPSGYFVAIVVKFPDGNFSAQTRGTDLQKTVIKASEAIIDQVRKWHQYRFAA